ncbi:undecaprenyl-phosphate glucose phosphotransferase [Pseudomonas sp. KU26590]|uniref:undecaprenyl-phosphate glucose phosphotransferase n=1 Tax=Pseudomonas sp. KU26590 TaxID=2991051 RepID=UPI000D35B54B|nr:undecaprenyl-phosphate glucose phosphotransferase [Pseudomonas sp. KU26590]UZJ59420.1 undecaprenyl-phosphate glucose phosphotransferase [Pseudomonas sp. KU26590]
MIAQRTNPAANRRGLTFWAHWAAALSAVCMFLFVMVIHRVGTFSPEYRALATITVLGSVPAYSFVRVYHKRFGYIAGLLRLLVGWTILLCGVLAFVWVGGFESLDKEILRDWAVCGFVVQALAFIPLRYLAVRHARQLRENRTSVIIGQGPIAQDLAQRLRPRVPLLGMLTLGPDEPVVQGPSKVIGHLGDLRGMIEAGTVRRVYIALPLEQNALTTQIYIDLLDMSVDVVWVPDLSSMPLLNQSIAQIEQLPAIYLNETTRSSHPAAAFAKELFDRSLALLGLLALSPLLVVVAIAVKASSPGPVFFRQPRHGWNGGIIRVWKFRSMRVHADTPVTTQATRSDPRITRVGALLRKSSVDELPQLINVLMGEMALVGPRPHAVSHNHYYSDKIRAYMARHRIKPGITGLAQISGLRGETETIEKMQLRVAKDLEYINHWSLWLDLKILVKTPFTLFSRNIY